MKRFLPFVILFVTLLLFLAATPSSVDLVLKGGKVIDGHGNPWIYADVGIQGDNIVAIAQPGTLKGKETLDVSGLYIAPGFIDLMGQSELQLFQNPHLKSKITQGITTEFTGEGGSAAPLNDWLSKEIDPFLMPSGLKIDWRTWDEYFDKARKHGFATNFAMMVGHSQVRQYAMKNDMRDPAPAELIVMKEQVDLAMRSGTFGVSTALLYAPASFAKTDEIVELARVASRYGGIYASHIRNESDRLLEAIDEAIEIGEKAGVPVEIWHLKVSGEQNFGIMKDALARIEAARSRGVDVTADIYPYTAGATALASSLPKWALEGGLDGMMNRLNDPAARDRIKQEMTTLNPDVENIFMNASAGRKIMIASVQNSELKKYVGKMLEEIARDHGTDEAETLCWMVETDRGATGAIYFTQSEEEMQKALKFPFVAFNCDYPAMAAEGELGKEHPHPRTYGTFPRILGRYVREQKLIPLEEAIRKMTSLPAQRLGLKKRGSICEGCYADITVFDFERVIDRATFENPNQYSEGIVHVFVNGVPVIRDGQITENLPGRILLHSQDN